MSYVRSVKAREIASIAVRSERHLGERAEVVEPVQMRAALGGVVSAHEQIHVVRVARTRGDGGKGRNSGKREDKEVNGGIVVKASTR